MVRRFTDEYFQMMGDLTDDELRFLELYAISEAKKKKTRGTKRLERGLSLQKRINKAVKVRPVKGGWETIPLLDGIKEGKEKEVMEAYRIQEEILADFIWMEKDVDEEMDQLLKETDEQVRRRLEKEKATRVRSYFIPVGVPRYEHKKGLSPKGFLPEAKTPIDPACTLPKAIGKKCSECDLAETCKEQMAWFGEETAWTVKSMGRRLLNGYRSGS